MKRELEQMEMVHNLYVGYQKQFLISDSLLLTLVFVAITLNVSSIILGLNRGRTWLVVIHMLLIFVNIYNTTITVRRMIKTRKEAKEEQFLYEQARADMVTLCEIEEELGIEVELE